ncbi:MAG TPA: PDZ domain-containing protein [Phycisphaerae bacterium]|nr:PDZ domain-containing protein [Phycisphaerae bacterium]
MLTLLSMLCACFVANPQAVVKTQSLTCGDADDTKAFVSKGQVCTVRIGSDTPSVGCCKSACGVTCGASGHACAVAGPGGARKIMCIAGQPRCCVAIGGGASSAGCCPSAGSACCPPAGPTRGVAGSQGTMKIMRIFATPAGAVGIGGSAPIPGACQAVAGPLCLAAGGDEDNEGVARIYLSSVPETAPKAWLGVSTSPVPEALKAHIGRGGLMIGNIVVDSPADEAGLQRYDVVVSFDGKAIEEMEDLLQALRDTEQGKTVEMVVIRKGKETKLTVTPGERPKDAAWEYKYEQEEEAVLDDTFIFRGHQLKLGPGGDVILQPLGRLKDLPDPLRSLQLLQRGDDDEDLIFRFDTDDEAHGEMEIKIDRDGEVLVIHRTKDGKVTVERADKEGETSSATYDSVEELKKEDPEAYKMLHQGGFGHAEGLNWIFRYPGLEELPKLQKRYQTHIDLNLQEILEKVREAQGDAGRTAEIALEQYREAREKAGRAKGEARKKLERWVSKKAAEVDLDITVADDGSISVSVRKGDTRVSYEFKSKDDFKEREPELFEKFRDALE